MCDRTVILRAVEDDGSLAGNTPRLPRVLDLDDALGRNPVVGWLEGGLCHFASGLCERRRHAERQKGRNAVRDRVED